MRYRRLDSMARQTSENTAIMFPVHLLATQVVWFARNIARRRHTATQQQVMFQEMLKELTELTNQPCCISFRVF